MNYNPYYNNPYMYGMQQQVQQQPQPQYQQQYYQQAPQQQIMFPLYLINGIEGAKAYIVGLNQTVYLKDNDSNMLYIKSADSQGKISLRALDTKEIRLEDVGKAKVEQKNEIDFVTKNDFNQFKDVFLDNLNKLSDKIEKLAKTKNSQEYKGGNK